MSSGPGKSALMYLKGAVAGLGSGRPRVRTLTRVLEPMITVPFAADFGTSSGSPVLVAITVDTEPGYVHRWGRRAWAGEKPEAYQGYTAGIRHWLEFARQAQVPLTFLLSTQCFSAEGEVLAEITQRLETILEEGHELGLHLHPSDDMALQKALGRRLPYGGASYYSAGEIEDMLFASRGLVRQYLGVEAAEGMSSFRWGNWSLHTNAVKALENQGFTVDSSSCPGMAGHLNGAGSDRAYDWRLVHRQTPWYLDPGDYQHVGSGASGVLELPVSVFRMGPYRFRASPALGPLLLAAGLRYCKLADPQSNVLVILSHSLEANRQDSRATPMLDGLQVTVDRLRSRADVSFETLGQVGKLQSPQMLKARVGDS